jgi:triacylglycerol lipase
MAIDSFHLVDPELREAVGYNPPDVPDPAQLPEQRRQYREQARLMEIPAVRGVVEREVHIDGPCGPESLRLYIVEPEAAGPHPLFYHVHGGGYFSGFPEMMRGTFVPLVGETGMTIVSVDYRLAPETPHPGPIDDCYAGLTWAYRHAAELGIDSSRIAIGGESAGGGLAAALTLLARDRGEVPICFQRLLCPMLDDRTSIADDPHPYTGQYIWNRAQNRFGWEALLGHEIGRDRVSPYAVPARATDLSGLPPTYIDTGALDLFLEENMDYARRLTRAGVPVELHVYPGGYHGFGAVPAARVTRLQRQLSNDALVRALFD